MSYEPYDNTRSSGLGNHWYDYSSSNPHTNDRYTRGGLAAERDYFVTSSQQFPHFRERMARGEILVGTLMRKHWQRTNPGGGSYSSLNNAGGYGSRCDSSPYGLTQEFMDSDGVYWAPPSYPTFVLNGAKSKALANIDPTPYQFGEDLGELALGIGAMGAPAMKFASGAHALVREARKATSDIAKYAADNWKAYRFGLLPALSSIENAYFGLGHNAATIRKNARRVARGSVDHQVSSDQSVTKSGKRYVMQGDYTYKSRAGVFYTTTNPAQDWRWELGLRNKDIPRTAWQLVSLSFMIDRVYNISNVISGLVNLSDPNLQILGGWYSEKLNSTVNMSFVSYSLSGWTISVSPDNICETEDTYIRTPWSPSFSDSLYAYTPLKDGLIKDATNVADLLSLGLGKLRSIAN